MSDQIQNLSEINRLVIAEGAVFGETTYRPRGSCGPRPQNDFQLVCVLAGSARVLVNDDREFHVPKNYVALMKPGHREHFFFDPQLPTHHTWCAVSLSLIPEPSRLEQCPDVIPLSLRMSNLISAGLDFQNDPRKDSAVQQIGLACLATYQFEATSGELASYPAPLARVVSAVERDLAYPWSVDVMAALACVSPQHLIRLFRKHQGQTPARYLWDLRVQRGTVLLRETGLSISEISDRVGFSTPYHFARLVKDRFGASPKAIRSQAWSLSANVHGDRNDRPMRNGSDVA